MRSRRNQGRIAICFILLTGVLAVHTIARADHDFFDGRHWNKTTITFVDSTTPEWDTAVQMAIDAWNAGLDNVEIKLVEGTATKKVRKSCPFPKGKVRLCNYPYNLSGLAEAHVDLTPNDHISKARIRFDEVELNFPSLPAVCHESGHTLGLDHRPQNQQNSTCMTYALFYAKPDAHDYDMIDALHAHVQ